TAVLDERVVSPIVYDEFAVNPEPHTIAALRVEGVRIIELGLHGAGPAHAESAGVNTDDRRSRTPIEIDRRVSSHYRRACEAKVIVISSEQTRSRTDATAAYAKYGRVG